MVHKVRVVFVDLELESFPLPAAVAWRYKDTICFNVAIAACARGFLERLKYW